MERILTYSDFENINTFARLIRWFNAQDYRYDGIVNAFNDSDEVLVNKICENDFSIIYQKEQDEFDEVFFLKHFISSKVESEEPLENYKKYIDNEIEEKFKYKPKERGLFIRDEINKLELLLIKVFTEPYFLDLFNDSISNQLLQSIDDLYSDESLIDKKDNSQKIKVKLSRSELTCLFFLLQQAHFIDHKYDSELGRLLENNFLYYNAEENSYKELININKLLSDMRNGHKSINAASEKLKEILSKTEFYELKP
jgi:hypothetical protein